MTSRFSDPRRRGATFLGLTLATLLLSACEPAPPETDQAATPPGLPTQTSGTTAAPLLHLTELATDEDDTRVGVLLHGYGSDEFDLIPLARQMGLHGPIESFVGPHDVGDRHGWFPIDFESDGARYSPEAADTVLERLASGLRQLRETHAGSEIVVVGFSQGAMMTLLLAAEHPDALDRGVALSGALPRPPKPSKKGASHPPVWMAHGTQDGVVPLERGRQAKEMMKEAGVPVSFHEFDRLGHRVDARVVDEASAWLASAPDVRRGD